MSIEYKTGPIWRDTEKKIPPWEWYILMECKLWSSGSLQCAGPWVVNTVCERLNKKTTTTIILYRRFRTTYRSHFQGSTSPRRTPGTSWTTGPLWMGPIGCPKTSVQDYQSTLRKAPEEPRSRLHLCGSLEPHISNTCLISSSPKDNGHLCLPIVCLQPLTFNTHNQHKFPPTRSILQLQFTFQFSNNKLLRSWCVHIQGWN